MTISAEQLSAIDVVQRTTAALSAVGTIFVVATFSFSHEYRKPPNRLIFHAAWGNIMSCVTCTIALSGPAQGEESPLCQAQGFFMQWFMWTDTFWGLCFALNVWLTIFHRFSPSRLQKLEWIYVACCYGLPGILALIFLFVHTEERGRVYGSAIIWCWIRDSWDILRIVAFYIPVWLAVLATMAILAITWRELIKTRNKLRQDLTTNSTELPGMVNRLQPTGPDSSETDFHTAGPHPLATGDDDELLMNTGSKISPLPRKQHFKSVMSGKQERAKGPRHGKPPTQKIDAATWAYAVYAIIYFVALLTTWIPPSITRVYSLIHRTDSGFVLNLLTALVLPLQGLWNAVIYAHVSRITIKRQSRQLWGIVTGSERATP